MGLPPELVTAGKKIELVINFVYINNESFLHSVNQNLQFNCLVVLGKKVNINYTSELSFEGLDDILLLYNPSYIYIYMCVTCIHYNNEFKKICWELDETWDVDFN